jgi:acyl-coenzyme A thioesterase PaaI-like protein
MTTPAPPTAPDAPSPCIDPALLHPECVVCAASNPRGLALKFDASADGRGVEATFECHEVFQGYIGLVHGGIVSAVLDGAMAHCLFHLGRVAHTGSLAVRFRHPVVVDRQARVRARLERSLGGMHMLSAELEQDGQVKVTASAKFVESRPVPATR